MLLWSRIRVCPILSYAPGARELPFLCGRVVPGALLSAEEPNALRAALSLIATHEVTASQAIKQIKYNTPARARLGPLSKIRGGMRRQR